MIGRSILRVAEQFTVTYDGPGVEDHTIDAAVFGESLLALSELIQDARDTIAADGPRYHIKVRTTGDGSYLVSLELREWWGTLASLFADPNAQAVAFLLQVLGRDGLLGFYLWLRGKTPTFRRSPDGRLMASVADREITIESNVGKLFASTKIRRSVRRLAGPIQEDQIDKIILDLPPGERSN